MSTVESVNMAGQILAGEDRLLSAREVAELFGVDPKTVSRWAGAGKLASVKTPGGHRRYRLSVVQELLTLDHATNTTQEEQQ